MTQRHRGYRFLAALTVAVARHDAALQRRRDRLRTVASHFLPQALNAEEASDLTLRLYDAAPAMYANKAGLMDWERTWYERDLPPAPAHILLGAAGSGRELAVLLANGYTVDAFEPVVPMAIACRAAGKDVEVLACDYDQFCAAVLDGAADPAAVFAGRTYDAVILGWGSLTNVLRDEDRRRLFKAAAHVATDGPILASFFLRSAATADSPPTRAARGGARLGRLLGRRRGIVPLDEPCDLFWHLGLTHTFTPEEIAALATAIGRTATCYTDGYGHATLRTQR
jgi:hypothetical protein